MSDKVSKDPRFNPRTPKKGFPKIWIFLVFIVILGGLFYFAFYNNTFSTNISTTGNVVDNPTINKDALSITAELIPPETLDINSKISKISLRTRGPAIFNIGKQKFELSKSTSIIINDFQGTLSLDSKNIFKLNGKTSKVFVDGNPITPSSESTMQISSEQESGYAYLELKGVYIKSLAYTTSGIIKLNKEKIKINLDNETINIQKFSGDLEIKSDLFKLNGHAQESNVLGSLDISYKA